MHSAAIDESVRVDLPTVLNDLSAYLSPPLESTAPYGALNGREN